MNCIIIDDDSFVRKITADFVQKTESLTLLHSLSNAVEAMELLRLEGNIDLVFLDIEMPEMTGIDFLNALNLPPQVIIVSSKEKYAIDAFDFDVTDYLLKPFSYERFSKAVSKAVERHEKNRIHSLNDEIFVRNNNLLLRLKIADILWVEAMENYISINTFDDKYTVFFRMSAIEKILPQQQFMRIHRSFIVNVERIHSIEDNSICFKTASTDRNIIPMGKTHKNMLFKRLHIVG